MASKVRLPFTKRALALVLALALAGLAAVALTSYVRGVERAALAENEPVEVFVAAEAIPAGTSAEDAIAAGMITRQPVPRRAVVQGTISSLGDIEDTVAAITIAPGEQLLAARFVSAVEAGVDLEIPEGMHAMSIEVGLPPGVSGFIEPGDHIGVLGYFVVEFEGEGTSSDGTTSTTETKDIDIVQFVMQDVEVLSVSPRIVSEATEIETDPAVTGRVLLTVALSPQDAEKLAYTHFVGDVYFTLMPDGADPTATTGVTIEQVVDFDVLLDAIAEIRGLEEEAS